MGFYNNDEYSSLKIVKSVFHIVGPDKDSDFRLLNEFDVGSLQEFFLERVRSVNEGSRYIFLDDSPIETQLSRILENKDNFQIESEKLAEGFQAIHKGNSSVGAFLVFMLQDDSNNVSFAFLKFDDENVVSYSFKEPSDGKRPTPEFGELTKTFVKNKDALQKAILIRVSSEVCDISVVDRQNNKQPAKYIGDYLHARRLFTKEDLTVKVKESLMETCKKHSSEIDDNVMKNLYLRVYDSAISGATFQGENPTEWLIGIIGNNKNIEQIAKTFHSKLKANRIDGETFEMVGSALKKPATRKINTFNGIKISAPTGLGEGILTVDEVNDQIIIRDKFTETLEP